MSTKTPPQPVSPGEPDGTDAMRQQPQSGTPDGNATASLPGAKEPHERDESPESQRTGRSPTDPVRKDMEQASEDIERGLVDTDRRGTPDDIPHQEHKHGT